MAPELNKILGVISKEDKALEIQRRLQEQETRKARNLLAQASSHAFALQTAKSIIEKQLEDVIKKINGSDSKPG